jgi:hypothetical protein
LKAKHALSEPLAWCYLPLTSTSCDPVAPNTDEKRVNKVVFIGKNLDRKELTDGFNACLVAAS